MKKLIINTDGGSRGNPGKAAAGFIICDGDGTLLSEGGAYLGIATNNDAEYAAVQKALEHVLEAFAGKLPLEIEFKADSTLVVNQLSGKYKIKSQKLLQVIQKIKELETRAGSVRYTYIPRAENAAADRIVNQVLDRNS